jgi:hypothetical protein
MHTLVVQMSTDPTRADEVEIHFRQDVIPWARRQAGFVSGQWLRAKDRRSGLGLVVFESSAAASAAASGPGYYGRDDTRAWNIESVTVQELVASA